MTEDPRVTGVHLKEGFLYSREYHVMNKILKSLEEKPKTLPGLVRELKEPKTTIFRALRRLVQWCSVYGNIHFETMKFTKGKLQPLYQATGFSPMMHGGGKSVKPSTIAYESMDGKKRTRYRVAKIVKGDIKLYSTPIPSKEDKIRNWKDNILV
jgi:hypothetical protein